METKSFNFLTCVARRYYEDIRAELTAALTGARITPMVSYGGYLKAAYDGQQE